MRTLATRSALMLAGGALVAATAACGTAKAGSPSGAGTDPSAGGLGGAPASASAQPTATGTTKTNETTKKPSASPSSSTHTNGGPKIVVFKVKKNPECPKGTNVNPIPGVPVTLEWQVTGADTVTLSVDGPGAYATYEPTGSTTINFPCGGPPNSVTTHTYMIKAEKDGKHASKTINASAKVNEIAVVN